MSHPNIPNIQICHTQIFQIFQYFTHKYSKYTNMSHLGLSLKCTFSKYSKVSLLEMCLLCCILHTGFILRSACYTRVWLGWVGLGWVGLGLTTGTAALDQWVLSLNLNISGFSYYTPWGPPPPSPLKIWQISLYWYLSANLSGGY